MKTYKDLDINGIAKEFGLDFGYHTYINGMCSCCYGPVDIDEGWINKDKPRDEKSSYLLGRNSENGSGEVKINDVLKKSVYINYYNIKREKLEKIVDKMQQNLGDEYLVLMPKEECYTIIIKINNDENKKLYEVNLRAYKKNVKKHKWESSI